MPRTRISLPPGMAGGGTLDAAKNRWYTGDRMRFVDGRPQGMLQETFLSLGTGGDVPLNSGYLRCGISDPFAMFGWLDGDRNARIAFAYRDTTASLTRVAVTEAIPTSGIARGTLGVDPNVNSIYTTSSPAPGVQSMDSWGSDLVFNAAGTIAQRWEPATNTLTALSAGPTGTGLIVTQERHLVILNAGGNPRKVQWASQESLTDWTPTPTNTAGDLIIETQGDLLRAMRFKDEVIVFTTTSVHRLVYRGGSIVYGQQEISSITGPITPRVVVDCGEFLMWLGRDGFYTYDGSVRAIPCPYWDARFARYARPDSNVPIVATHHPQFREVWFTISVDPASQEGAHLIYNYGSSIWYESYRPINNIGIGVSASLTVPFLSSPIVAGALVAPPPRTYLYFLDGQVPNLRSVQYQATITSGPLEFGEGEKRVRIKAIVGDYEVYESVFDPNPTILFDISANDGGEGAPDTQTASGALSGKTFLRLDGRTMQLTYKAGLSVPGVGGGIVRFGDALIDYDLAGER